MTKTCIDIAKELRVDQAAADIDREDAPRALQRLTRVRVNGQNEQALDHLERICRDTPFFTPGWLKLDPMYEPLRGDSRFERLLTGAPAVQSSYWDENS